MTRLKQSIAAKKRWERERQKSEVNVNYYFNLAKVLSRKFKLDKLLSMFK